MEPEEQTPMRRLPEEEIVQTRESMLLQLKVAAEDLFLRHDKHGDRDAYRVGIARVRTLADEILRWELL
jgi:hypothetical protein